jgi:hypothetical protein
MANAAVVRATNRASSGETRVAAVAGFISSAAFVPAFLLIPAILPGMDPTAIARGLAQFAAHRGVAVACQSFWAISDLASIFLIVAVVQLTEVADHAWARMGSLLWAISRIFDVVVAASFISVATFLAPAAATDPMMRAAGAATISFASVLDRMGGYIGGAGELLIGLTLWRSAKCPKWLAALTLFLGLADVLPDSAFNWLPFAAEFYPINGLTTLWLFVLSLLLWRGATSVTASGTP